MAQQGHKPEISQRDHKELREALLESLSTGEPELTFTPRGNPDPRLLRLVEFLARQAARDCYAEEVKMTRRRGKRTS